jgi:hypothetical protein
MLDAALAWAARGFRVFPLRAGTKDQPLFDGWTQLASSDPATIRGWWQDALGLGIADHNIGVLTTGMVVVDLDVGKGGLESALALDLDLLGTLLVRTPKGGLHAYYTGPDSANTVEAIAPGVDIRSHNGYVLAPGSVRPDGAYTLELDLPVAKVPDQIAMHLTAPLERREIGALVELDTLEAVDMAGEFLARAPAAIEGQGGDNTTYQVCCRLRDFGVSEDMAYALMLDGWNDRCAPPWEPEELRLKVANAYQYATGAAGQAHPQVHFDGVVVPELPPLPEPELALPAGGFGNALDILKIPKRDWIIARLLLRKYVTSVVAPGGAAKSTLVLIIAAHMALGRDFAGFKLQQGRSVIYNAEDDIAEQSRRLHAICQWYGMPFDEVRKNICLLDGTENPILLVKRSEKGVPTLNREAVQQLVKLASPDDVLMLAVDPLVELHECDENDNVAMRYVMTILRLIAATANIGMIVPHHTAKRGAKAGDADSGRGAGSVVNATRVSLTLVPASEEDCDRYGINEEDRYEYVRLDDAKMNLSLQRGKPTWFQKHGVDLANGDQVGVVAPVDLDLSSALVAKQMAATIIAAIRAASTSTITVKDAVDVLMASDPLYANMAKRAVQARLQNFLRRPVDVDGDLLSPGIEGRTAILFLS